MLILLYNGAEKKSIRKAISADEKAITLIVCNPSSGVLKKIRNCIFLHIVI